MREERLRWALRYILCHPDISPEIVADVGRLLEMSYTAVSKRLKAMNIEIDKNSKRRKYSEKECIVCGKFFEPTNSTAKKCIPCR